MRRDSRGSRQGTFEFPLGWGGARAGAGRKPKGEKAGVSHRRREALASRFPVHVTVRLVKGLPSLRRKAAYGVLQEAFRKGNGAAGFRVVQYAVLSNHVHFVIEAQGRERLARGMQGLSVRMARGLNRLWKRRGKVFADRYHDRILRTPREVRNALVYVLNNARRHGLRIAKEKADPFTSARWFDGWRGFDPFPRTGLLPVELARTWLLEKGWRKHGLLPVSEIPGG